MSLAPGKWRQKGWAFKSNLGMFEARLCSMRPCLEKERKEGRKREREGKREARREGGKKGGRKREGSEMYIEWPVYGPACNRSLKNCGYNKASQIGYHSHGG